MAKGVSLHIGLNEVDPTHYGGWSGPLNACEADAEDMAALAESQGFAAQALLTQHATRGAVVDRLREEISSLESGDILFVTYSGHGGQVPDRSRDEPDYQDETWCLYDAQVIDDELYELWAECAAGVRILVVSDSCHSGTVTRAPISSGLEAVRQGPAAEELGIEGATYRFMPVGAAMRTYRANKAFYDEIQEQLPEKPSEISASVRLISGCQDNQVSLDGTFNGLFTGVLLRVWNSGRFRGNYDKFHRAILKRMPATQSPNHFVIGAPNRAFDKEKPFSV